MLCTSQSMHKLQPYFVLTVSWACHLQKCRQRQGIKVLSEFLLSSFQCTAVHLRDKYTNSKIKFLTCQFWPTYLLLGGFHNSFCVQVNSYLITLLISKRPSHPSLWDCHLICSFKQNQPVHSSPHSFIQCFVCAALCKSWTCACLSEWGDLLPCTSTCLWCPLTLAHISFTPSFLACPTHTWTSCSSASSWVALDFLVLSHLCMSFSDQTLYTAYALCQGMPGTMVCVPGRMARVSSTLRFFH